MVFVGVALLLTASFWQAYTCIPSKFPPAEPPPTLQAHPSMMRFVWVAAYVAGLSLLFAEDVVCGVGGMLGYCVFARLVSVPLLQHTVYRT